ncbi:hypothetical protein BLNAU_8995 [Blattamonas nauphoetae]|uniref:peptidylprolyl isomerase n=1 Tax=Blattamonas nauphoetae TaxID=2049346 RepID=A0ABQ9XX11_9EUKA|nr:hypothetical protein BLNAU_8995 [Blattamonas nauphoetae]
MLLHLLFGILWASEAITDETLPPDDLETKSPDIEQEIKKNVSDVNPRFFERFDDDELHIETLKRPRRCTRRVKKWDEVETTYKIMKYCDLKVVDETTETEVYVFRIGYNETLPGVEIGLIGCCVGETRRLTIPAALGYAEDGCGPIRPNESLIVEITVIDHIARSESAEYRENMKNIRWDAEKTSRPLVEKYNVPPFIRPQRWTLTIPQEGLEIKKGDAKKRIKGIPYPNFHYHILENDKKKLLEGHKNKPNMKRSYQESEHYSVYKDANGTERRTWKKKRNPKKRTKKTVDLETPLDTTNNTTAVTNENEPFVDEHPVEEQTEILHSEDEAILTPSTPVDHVPPPHTPEPTATEPISSDQVSEHVEELDVSKVSEVPPLSSDSDAVETKEKDEL